MQQTGTIILQKIILLSLNSIKSGTVKLPVLLQGEALRTIFTKPLLVNTIAVLSFFPFFAFLPGLEAEVQPYCYFVTFFFLILYKEQLPYQLFLFLIVVLLYFLVFLLNDFLLEPEVKKIPHLLIYIGPGLFFYTMYKYFNLLNTKLLHNIFYVWAATGILQQFFPQFFSLTGLNIILQYLLPRFKAERLVEAGDRGVDSLSNEPSHAGIIFFALFMLVIYRYLKKEISAKSMAFNTVLFLVSFVFNASVTMLIGLVVVAFAVIHQTKSYISVLTVLTALLIPLFYFDVDFRIIALAKQMPNMLAANNNSIYDVMVGPMGSNREFSSYVGIRSGFYHFMGNGFYSSLTDFIKVSDGMGVSLKKVSFFDFHYNGQLVTMKPFGFGSLTLFELGWIPFILINSILVKLFFIYSKNKTPYKRLATFLAVSVFIFINFYSLASLPTYWFCFAIAMKMMEIKTA